MLLHSQRLTLRPIALEDLDALHQLHTLPETDAYNTLGIPENIETTQELLKNWLEQMQAQPPQKYVWVIEHETTEWIGIIGLNMGKPKYFNAETWYKIHPAHWNKGYASEGVQCILQFCFNELKLHRVEAGCATDNLASVKVLEKCGFKREGHCRKKLPIRGKWMDNYEYAILETEFSGY